MGKQTYTYVYTYVRKNNDVNGNPRHYVTVYRVKNNIPHRLGDPDHDVGYRGEEQAVCDVILDNEAGWGKRYNSKHGSENPVWNAMARGSYEGAKDHMGRAGGKIVKLHRVGGNK